MRPLQGGLRRLLELRRLMEKAPKIKPTKPPEYYKQAFSKPEYKLKKTIKGGE